ncbi:MAG TPA: histidine kinase [Thermoanaerobaculia bacterium]|nr:histidine kinase [Thermoanaerobaculia bacterium]
MRRLPLILLVLIATSCARYRDAGARFGGGTRAIDHGTVGIGDDARWALPSCDECARWRRQPLYADLPESGTFWIRMPVDVDAHAAQKPAGIYVSLLATTEVFWDGVPIGASGTPAPIDNFFAVRTTPGTHLLALRVRPSRDAARVRYFGGIAIGDYAHMVRTRIVAQMVPLSGMGVFVVIGIYFLVLSRASERRAPLIVFAILCFTASLLVVAETWRWMVGYSVDFHLARLQLVTALTAAIALLLPLFFALELRLRRTTIWFALASIAVLTSLAVEQTSDDRCFAMMRAAVIACAVMTLAGIPTRKREAAPLLLGILILGGALVAGGYAFSDSSFFIAFGAFIVLLLVSLALEADRERRRRESAELRAARLEIELLEKSIQPHFLMNTITAVMEWIEESPSEGVRFLESLADELRLFGEMAGERVVPLARELALCRTHLTIMSCRTRTPFELDASGVNPDDDVPPAIFHTLIENAITHNRYGDEAVLFHLAAAYDGATRRYDFDAPLRGSASGPLRDGVGLRYVKTRLEEVFPGRWRVDAREHGAAWRTTIEVRA